MKYLFVLLFAPCICFSQSKITGNTSTIEANSTKQGVLLPCMNTLQQNAINPLANGLIIFNTDSAGIVGYSALNGWRRYVNSAWSPAGNSVHNTEMNFIGTTDNVGLRLKTNNVTFGYIDSSQIIQFTTPLPNNCSAYIYNGYITLFGRKIYGNGLDYFNPASGLHALCFGGNFTPLGGETSEINEGIVNSNTFEEAVHTAHKNGSGAYEVGMEIITKTGIAKILEQNTPPFISMNALTDSVNVRSAFVNMYTKLKLQDGTQSADKVLTSDASGNASWKLPVASGATGNEPGNPYPGQSYFDTTLKKDEILEPDNVGYYFFNTLMDIADIVRHLTKNYLRAGAQGACTGQSGALRL